ncbi:suppressor of glycerol defect [Coemansia sp. RSA 1646]|nr:suppressor of glycerol defect [Coemansia sp. RSA 1646]KAJ1773963.1 suppressor of glycerol defect [Coemansia sp. RSA 1843]KAJ2213402.1 suppressor of glycerol defect [Coemansia sp. RSA 487]
MPSKRRYQENTALPTKLAHQIEGKNSKTGAPAVAEDDGRFKKRFKNNIKTRKQARKQAREDKKQRRSDFHQRKHGVSDNLREAKKNDSNKKNGGGTTQQAKAVKKAPELKKPTAGAEKIDERARLAKFAKRNTSMYQLLRDSNLIENVDKEAGIATSTAAADLEERELRRLERNLGMKATSKLENAFYAEGLGDLLEGISHGSKSLRGNDKDPEPAATAERKSKGAEELDEPEQSTSSEEEDDVESIDSEGEDDSDSDDAFGLNNLEMDDDGSGSEAEDSDIAEMYKEQGIDINPELLADDYGTDSENDDASDNNNSSEEEVPEDESDLNKLANAVSPAMTTNAVKDVESKVGRYIPPSLRRQQAEAEDERVIAIRKVLQGQLNRLSETNIESIVVQTEALYTKYPRHHVTNVLTGILLQSIQSRSNMLDTFLYVNAALVGAVYRAVGLDPVAHLVQTMMEQFEQFFDKGLAEFKATDDKDDEGDNDDELTSGKQCQNLGVFVAELYNFQVISCQLVYDVIRLCTKDINEFTAEILLKIIRISGVQLRKDDPLALKEIVQHVNDEVNARGANKLSVRCQFMVENLMNLKDNRMRNAMSQNADNVAKLKRLLGNMDKRRSVGAVEPINIGLQDIRDIDTKGKWWLVGASWVGNQHTGDGNSGAAREAAGGSSGAQGTGAGDGNLEMDRLLQLARSQHMNTDVRRSIFVTLLSSDDYADAFDRLLKLNLKKTQTREVVRVVLHCCGQEQAYNPYYALVAFRLCSHHSSYAHTLQYALWDFLRELGEVDVGGLGRIGQDEAEGAEAAVPLRRIVNTAKLYAWLIDKQALSLLVLKTVTFASVRQQARTFFQVLFSTLFLQHKKRTPQDAQALVSVFQKATANATMCQGMLLFFHHFVKKCEIVSEDELPVLKWGCRVAKKVFHSVEPSSGYDMF